MIKMLKNLQRFGDIGPVPADVFSHINIWTSKTSQSFPRQGRLIREATAETRIHGGGGAVGGQWAEGGGLRYTRI